MKPTYEELETKIHRLEELLTQALEKIAKLEEQLKRNSKNSSKPPSTDQKGNTADADKKPPRESRAGKARASFPPDKVDRHVKQGGNVLRFVQKAIECFYSQTLPPLIFEAMGF